LIPPKENVMKSQWSRSIVGFLVFAFIFIGNHIWAEAATRNITVIRGDLYRFQNNFHTSVFLVTPQGVIATDPINAAAARWLKKELKVRFNQTVKYLIYSHDHGDHISGGEVFADTAVIVAHQYTKKAIIQEKRSTAIPQVTYSEQMTIELGGEQVHLIYVGKSHSNNMTAVYFPGQGTMFTVDFISVNRLPYKNLGDSYFPDWIDAIKKVEGFDFDILVPGHGAIGRKVDVTRHRQYIETLYREVLRQVREGKSLSQIQRDTKMKGYEKWGQYKEWLPLNIEGIYQRIVLQRRGN